MRLPNRQRPLNSARNRTRQTPAAEATACKTLRLPACRQSWYSPTPAGYSSPPVGIRQRRLGPFGPESQALWLETDEASHHHFLSAADWIACAQLRATV